MEVYYPIMVRDQSGELEDIYFLDKEGIKVLPDECAAIFNGIEIDVNKHREEDDFNDNSNNSQ